jgi:hypothetical protein
MPTLTFAIVDACFREAAMVTNALNLAGVWFGKGECGGRL